MVFNLLPALVESLRKYKSRLPDLLLLSGLRSGWWRWREFHPRFSQTFFCIEFSKVFLFLPPISATKLHLTPQSTLMPWLSRDPSGASNAAGEPLCLDDR